MKHKGLNMLSRLLVLGALALVAGCNRSPFTMGKVTGVVTLKGRPVTQGKVMFRPAQGPMASGELGPGGVYHLTTHTAGDGAIVGECAVAIVAPRHGAAMGGYTPPPPPPPEEAIPLKFHDYQTSGLKRTVKEGSNEIDFELSEL